MSVTMFLNEDLQCTVCCYEYSCSDRIPRQLHCKHTFCTPCLEKVAKVQGTIRILTCPLCRWMTCTRSNVTLPESLWVNTEMWDQIGERKTMKRSTLLDNLNFAKTQNTASQLSPDLRWSSFMSTMQNIFRSVLLKTKQRNRVQRRKI